MIEGKVEALSIFKIVRSILGRSMTGVLTLEQDDMLKRFAFFKGQARLSYSNLEQEHLAYRLRDLGLLSSIELHELRKDERFNNELLVEEVLSRGLVKDLRLSRIESSLTRERLLQAFEWSGGQYTFLEEAPSAELPPLQIDMTALLVEAAFIRTPFPVCERFVRNMDQRQVLKRVGIASASVEEAIRDTWVFRQSVEGVSLSSILADPSSLHINVRAAAAMILAGVGSLKPAKEGEGGSPPAATEIPPKSEQSRSSAAAENTVIGSREVDFSKRDVDDAKQQTDSRRVVLRASGSGSQDRGNKPREIQKARPRTSSPPKPKGPSRARETQAASAGSGTSSKKTPRQSDDILTELTDDVIRELPNLPDNERLRLLEARKLIAAAPRSDHYQILGVSREASPESVRETFRRLAREFHADRFSRYNLPDSVNHLIQLTFVTINASNEVLGDPERRRDYDLELSLAKRVERGSTKPSAGAPQELDRALKAERELDAAIQLLCRGEAEGGRKRLTRATDLGYDGEIIEVLRAYLTYVASLSDNQAPTSIKRKTLEKLLKFASTSEAYPSVYLFIGRIYKRDNEQKRALAAFKKAVELDVNFAEASSELRYLQRQMESKKGFLRR